MSLFQRSCFATMNSDPKRVKLSTSIPVPATTSARPLQLVSHDALLHEEEGYLLVEEDTTDSSLIITMGNTCTHRVSVVLGGPGSLIN